MAAFRIGEIITAAGARLREVGSTNQTYLADYEAAINPETRLILTVHRSNFFMEGFVESPGLAPLAQLARRKKMPLVADLGSGAIGDVRRNFTESRSRRREKRSSPAPTWFASAATNYSAVLRRESSPGVRAW